MIEFLFYFVLTLTKDNTTPKIKIFYFDCRKVDVCLREKFFLFIIIRQLLIILVTTLFQIKNATKE